ncbi:MAG: hypothetical protein ABSG37_06485 [Candidatus Limnocylindrales bacterium]
MGFATVEDQARPRTSEVRAIWIAARGCLAGQARLPGMPVQLVFALETLGFEAPY